MRTQFDTVTVRAADIFSNGRTYEVPPYQRNYAWSDEEWELLWEDLMLLHKGEETFHYMGPLLFQEKGDHDGDRFLIIDGQQRLATLTLLALAAIHRFTSWAEEAGQSDGTEHRERADIFRRRFIGEKEPTALYVRSRVNLNKVDDDFFQDLLSDHYRSRPPVLARLPDSHQQLYRCYRFFARKIADTFPTSLELAVFLEKTVAQKLLFTRILVADESNAYLIFETLNARGVELAPNDLIKNYLFSILDRQRVPRQDIERLLSHWDNMLRDLGPRGFVRFLRAYLNTHTAPVVRQERLFRHVKQEVQTREAVQDLVDDLREKAVLYSALQSPGDEFWNEWAQQDALRFYLALLRLFGVRQHVPLVFAVYDAVVDGRLERGDLVRLLRYVTVIAFRYNVIGKRNPNRMEEVYNRIAVALSTGEIATWGEVSRRLRPLYIPDNEFEQAFANAGFGTRRYRRLVKYILLSLERYAGQPERARFENPDLLGQINDSRITIEHILPQDYTDDWPEFAGYEHERYVSRLGNLTLLEDTLNREATNRPFAAKRALYGRSQYVLTQAVATREEWTPDAVQHRQRELARSALHIWRLDF